MIYMLIIKLYEQPPRPVDSASSSQCHPAIRSIRLLLTVFLLPLLLAPAVAVQAFEAVSDASGQALAQQIYDRPNGKDASAKVLMRLQGKGKEPSERLLFTYAKDKGDAEHWTLLRFAEPGDIAGTGLLTIDYPGDKSDQWLYLPALDRVRRISSSRKGGKFVGSDFYYEDLMDREVDMDHHQLLGREVLSGIECFVLESIPVDPDNSVYSKRVSWVHPGIMLPLKIEFYEKNRDKPAKRLKASKIKKVQGYWTVFDSTMVTLKTGHKTKLLTMDITYDQELPDALFTQQGLSDDSREQTFRPDASPKPE